MANSEPFLLKLEHLPAVHGGIVQVTVRPQHLPPGMWVRHGIVIEVDFHPLLIILVDFQ